MYEMMGGPEDDETMMALDGLVHVVDRLIQEPKRRRKAECHPDEKAP
jgi:hypothetical protein